MTIGIRQIARNVNLLAEYDYIDIEDKKTHEYKGLFVSPKYAEEFKAFLNEKLAKEKAEKLERLSGFVGSMPLKEELAQSDAETIKKAHAQSRTDAS